jgi:hypothetical protein
VSRVDTYFLKGPKRGSFEVVVDGKPTGTIVDTQADDYSAGFHLTRFADGPHKITFVSRGRGPVRFFGTSMERESPGIIVDSLGVGASNTHTMMRQNADIYKQAAAHRNYDLIIFFHGTFDLVPWGRDPEHERWVKEMIDRHRAATPSIGILIMSPPDRTAAPSSSMPMKEVIECGQQKKQYAEKYECAFWDFREAMGGTNSMLRFNARRMAINDFIHFTKSGGAYMGSRIAHALVRDFRAYLKEHPQAGCSEDPSARALKKAEPKEDNAEKLSHSESFLKGNQRTCLLGPNAHNRSYNGYDAKRLSVCILFSISRKIRGLCSYEESNWAGYLYCTRKHNGMRWIPSPAWPTSAKAEGTRKAAS